GSTAAAATSLPAVGHATDLKVEPVIGSGPQPAPSSLVTRDLVVGTGAAATASSTVEVQYVGASYATGADFDSSWSRGQPATFSLAQVVPGFAQGIVGMHVGGRREIVIPPALGYGSSGSPAAPGSPQAVGPNETIVFVVDLLAVK
nr:FKBP-type peptidyl-prolyl cis-trans isomerase [Actinomycetota bacterium]